jgi:hypothetical protein
MEATSSHLCGAGTGFDGHARLGFECCVSHGHRRAFGIACGLHAGVELFRQGVDQAGAEPGLTNNNRIWA